MKNILLLLMIFTWGCKDNVGFIAVSNLEKTQSYKSKLDNIVVYKNSKLDTTLIHDRLELGEFYPQRKDYIVEENGRTTFYLEKDNSKIEDDVAIIIIGEINNGTLQNVYYSEFSQAAWHWKMVTGNYEVSDNQTAIQLQLKVKSVDHALSFCIRFPYNEKGLYDWDVDRYLDVEVVLNLDSNEQHELIKPQYSSVENNGMLTDRVVSRDQYSIITKESIINQYLTEETLIDIVSRKNNFVDKGILLDSTYNYIFPCDERDTLSLFFIHPKIKTVKDMTVGLIKLNPNEIKKTPVSLIELIGVFARYRINGKKFIPPVLFEIYAYQRNEYCYKCTVAL